MFCHVTNPEHVGPVDGELAVDEVIGEICPWVTPRRPVLAPSINALDAGMTHQAFDAPDADVDPLAEAQLGIDAPRPIGAAGLGVDLGDDAGEDLARRRAGSGVLATLAPVVVARRRDPEARTEHGHRVAGLLRLDEGEGSRER